MKKKSNVNSSSTSESELIDDIQKLDPWSENKNIVSEEK